MNETGFIKAFNNPIAEFSPYPFWFLNDELNENRLKKQIDDFYEKGINAFVLHPRIGIPQNTPYLSDRFMYFMDVCIKYAHSKNMKVLLYDEGMYPSGSACGQVVKDNPEFASRALFVQELKNEEMPELMPHYEIEGVYNILFQGDRVKSCKRIDITEECKQGRKFAFILGFTGGTIRGIHEGQDDGMPQAPRSADILNPKATEKFIELTHERYYSYFQEFFGNTIIGFFTDEPMIAGRGPKRKNSIIWTKGFEKYIKGLFVGLDDILPALFFDMGEKSKRVKEAYSIALQDKLRETFFKPMYKWCQKHNIVLTGHPDGLSNISTQKYMHFPGQQIVWRSISQDNNLESKNSIMAKCSSDAARHLNRRRNLNECFGACGNPPNSWSFTYGDMIWYLNFLFARGVNFIVPHAFYYSLRTSLQYNERPPDVGLNNIWWEDYKEISDYIKRFSWVNTDSRNFPLAAVLCSNNNMPYKSVKCLYENQIPFNYLYSEHLIDNSAEIKSGKVIINGYSYSILLYEEGLFISDELKKCLEEFEKQGGLVFASQPEFNMKFYDYIVENAEIKDTFIPKKGSCKKCIRLEKLYKNGLTMFVVVNEGNKKETGSLCTAEQGKCMYYDPLTAFSQELPVKIKENKMTVRLSLLPGKAVIITVDASQEALEGEGKEKSILYVKLFEIEKNPETTQEGYFGDVIYNCKANIEEGYEKYVLSLKEVNSKCKVYVNDKHVTNLYMEPWEADITKAVRIGENKIVLKVHSSMANKYGAKEKVGIVF